MCGAYSLTIGVLDAGLAVSGAVRNLTPHRLTEVWCVLYKSLFGYTRQETLQGSNCPLRTVH